MIAKKHKFKTIGADTSVRQGRLAKAQQFLQVADDARELSEDNEVADAAVTLYIHAGIAAADALCAAALGEHAQGTDHRQAVSLLGSVDKEAAKYLDTLLRMKTRAGYGHHPINESNLRKAARAATALVSQAVL